MGQLLSHPLTEKKIIYNDYTAQTNLQVLVSQQQCLKPDRSGERVHRHLHLRRHNNLKATCIEPNVYELRDEPFKPGVGNYVQFYNCVGSMQGYRLTQEDAHLLSNCNTQLAAAFRNPFKKDNIDTLYMSVFGVFDGHGGDECSFFLANSPNGLRKWIKYSFENHKYGKYGADLDDNVNIKRRFRTIDGLVSQVLKDSFALQDVELHKHFSNSTCGSTAIVAIIINSKILYVANCGDSRCILSSENKCIKTMSFDHKPQHIGELIRINDDGGAVSLGRVGGVLALSRAFGDFQFKRNVAYDGIKQNEHNFKKSHVPFSESQVTVEPDVLIHRLDYCKDEFLVLACDGIWDIYSNKSLIQFVKYHLTLGLKLDEIVTKLLDHGISNANSNTGVGFDNMTIIILVLNKPGETLEQWYLKMKSRLEKEKGLF